EDEEFNKYREESVNNELEKVDKMSKRLRVKYIELDQDNLNEDQEEGKKESEDNNKYIDND
ncbi:1611_t:CDS:2, partial [Cetraspora pellucida]